MKRVTAKGIERYLIENYGVCRHSPEAMSRACQETAKEWKCKPIEMFHFMVEQEPLPNHYTHSYGFNTALGREIREDFEANYHMVRT